MEIAENLLIMNEEGKLIIKTFSLENGKSNSWGVTKLGALITKLCEEGETGDVLKKTNQFTLSFGKFVLVFHNPKECQEFFESFVDKITTDVFDENGVRITREEEFKRSFVIKEDNDDSEEEFLPKHVNYVDLSEDIERITLEIKPTDDEKTRKTKIHNFVEKIPH